MMQEQNNVLSQTERGLKCQYKQSQNIIPKLIAKDTRMRNIKTIIPLF